VELNTGEIAIVKGIHHHVPPTPVVLLVKSAGNTLLSKSHELDLYGQIETPRCKIAAILDPHKASLGSANYFDKKQLLRKSLHPRSRKPTKIFPLFANDPS